VIFSSVGRQVITGSSDHTARTWDARSGSQMLSMRYQDCQIECVAFSPDGKLIASGPDKNVHLSDAETGQEIQSLKGHWNWVMSLSFSHDGRLLTSGSADKTVWV